MKPVYVAMGANLPHPDWGPPAATLGAALRALAEFGAAARIQSPWYESAPVPPSGQPWYVNGVAEIATDLPPLPLLEALNRVEADFGRVRAEANAARAIDLDLIDYGGQVMDTPCLTLPHPRAHLRAFVLLPLRDIAPDWRHPVTGLSVAELLSALPPGQQTRQLANPG